MYLIKLINIYQEIIKIFNYGTHVICYVLNFI